MRKVILVGTAYPYRGGGISTFNERLAQAFIDNGDQIEIYNFTLQYPSFLFPGKTQYSTEAPPEGLKILRKVNSINPFNWIKIGFELRKRKPDLIIIRYWTPFMAPCLGTISRVARKNKITKVVAVTDNIIPHEKMPFGDRLSRYFVRSCDGFITMSHSVEQDLKKLNSDKPAVYSPHPLYDNFGSLLDKTEAKLSLGLNMDYSYILFFGFIREYKGLDLLLQAFSDVRFRSMKVKLLIAGEFYIDKQPYLDLINKNNLSDFIELHTDFIPNTEVNKYFSACDIVAQPYKHATQSGVTQIAYHFNKPMLTTNVGGLAELIPHGKVGYVVEPDHRQIADALIDFYRNNRESDLINNVKDEKLKFTWSTFLDNIYYIYNQI